METRQKKPGRGFNNASSCENVLSLLIPAHFNQTAQCSGRTRGLHLTYAFQLFQFHWARTKKLNRETKGQEKKERRASFDANHYTQPSTKPLKAQTRGNVCSCSSKPTTQNENMCSCTYSKCVPVDAGQRRWCCVTQPNPGLR